MKSLCKLNVLAGLLSLLFAVPALGQITTSVNFTTTFPFYAGNVKLPAGSYTVTQNNAGNDPGALFLLIESTDGAHSAFLDVDPTTSEKPHGQTDVTFNKYGKNDFLNMLWMQGQNSGMQVVPSRFEQASAKGASPTRHSVPAK
jgi:hypothetical protein